MNPGKYKVISTHDISTLTKVSKKHKFETETKLKKMKETTNCEYFELGKSKIL